MSWSLWDVAAFVAFVGAVIVVSLRASRRDATGEDYFLAGRGLSWWLIGVSLIASNISTEHFVGMAGAGFGAAGLAVASYEWIGAVALVVVAFVFLPLYLKLGLYTMPEFLEHRYGPVPRLLMAVYMMMAYVGVAIAAVLYSGALGLEAIFGLDLLAGIWLIGLLAGCYTIYGGLRAVVWSDLLQGAALLAGGLAVFVLGLHAVGGWEAFRSINHEKLHVVLPAGHPELPWTALVFGIWIPNFFYWGFNQFITQRALGARSLIEGQRGLVFAAALKLLMPIIVVLPGIMAFQLYGEQIVNPDQAYAVMIQHLLPVGLRGLLFAALLGAVMSSLDSMLNSASTIFTMDLYRRHWRPDAPAARLVRIGRLATALFVVVGCGLAPLPGRFEGVFQYIQLVWGFISPAVVAVFVVGLAVRRVPASGATAALLLGVPLYGALVWTLPDVAFLNHMAITFVALVAVMLIAAVVAPDRHPRKLAREPIDLVASADRPALIAGGLVIASTLGLYLLFW